MRKLFTTDRT